MTDHTKLLPVGIVRRGVAVIEDHYQVAVGLGCRVRTLIEITGARTSRRIEGVAEKAKRTGAAADLFRCGPRESMVGRHGTKNDGTAIGIGFGATREVEDCPGGIHVVTVRTAPKAIGCDEWLVERGARIIFFVHDEAPAK